MIKSYHVCFLYIVIILTFRVSWSINSWYFQSNLGKCALCKKNSQETKYVDLVQNLFEMKKNKTDRFYVIDFQTKVKLHLKDDSFILPMATNAAERHFVNTMLEEARINQRRKDDIAKRKTAIAVAKIHGRNSLWAYGLQAVVLGGLICSGFHVHGIHLANSFRPSLQSVIDWLNSGFGSWLLGNKQYKRP